MKSSCNRIWLIVCSSPHYKAWRVSHTQSAGSPVFIALLHAASELPSSQVQLQGIICPFSQPKDPTPLSGLCLKKIFTKMNRGFISALIKHKRNFLFCLTVVDCIKLIIHYDRGKSWAFLNKRDSPTTSESSVVPCGFEQTPVKIDVSESETVCQPLSELASPSISLCDSRL